MRYVYKKGDHYVNDDGKKVTDKRVLAQVQKIYIAPAYTEVKIDLDPKSKILYTALDKGGKRQYFYKPFWNEAQDRKKFCKLIEFGEQMPKIKQDITKLLTTPGWSLDKLIAIQLQLMLLCNFRVGNEYSNKRTESVGISTLRGEHLVFKKALIIEFIGKSHQLNRCELTEKRIVRLLNELRARAGDGLLFVDDDGVHADSVRINNFLKQYGPFTSKEFRTWVANTVYIDSIKVAPDVKTAVKNVAEQLHHTTAICKKKYIHPALIELYHDTNRPPMKANADKVFVTFLKERC